MHPCELPDDQLLKTCEVRRQRRAGPGGQHRNKVETAVVLIHRPSGERAEATERRSQFENRRVALARLRVNLALHLRATRSVATTPSPRWAARCRTAEFRVSVDHNDFAPLLAEALDVIEMQHYDVAAAAHCLTVTSSQLVRFLKLDARALQRVNQQRDSLGMHRLR